VQELLQQPVMTQDFESALLAGGRQADAVMFFIVNKRRPVSRLRGIDPIQEIRDDIQQGLVARRDLPKLRVQARRPPLAAMVQPLPFAEALRVYDAATPEERKQIALEVRKKVRAARARPYEWTPKVEQLATKYFAIRPQIEDFASPSALQ
jgi:hypothetical protein